MNIKLLLVAMYLVISLAGVAYAEEAPKPKNIPRKYSDHIELHDVTFEKQTPGDLKKESNSSIKNGLLDDVDFSSGSSLMMTPSSFVPPQPPPRLGPKKKENDNSLWGNDSKDTEKEKPSGWGWLADDVAKSKNEKEKVQEDPGAFDENSEEEFYSMSTMDRISGWEKSDSGFIHNPSLDPMQVEDNASGSSQKNGKPVIEKAALDSMADRFEKEDMKTMVENVDTDQSHDQPEELNISKQDADLPITKALLSESPSDNSINNQFAPKLSGEITANASAFVPTKSETSMFSPMPLSAVSIDNDSFHRKSASSFDSGSSWGAGFEQPKSSPFSSPYASSTPSPLSASKPLGESLFSSSPTPTPSSWSAEGNKGSQGIRTQALPW